MNKKWEFVRRLYLCKCSLCFKKREDFVQHLKDCKRWREYHYAPDCNEVKFVLFEIKKK